MTYTTLDPINNNFICNQPLHRDDFNYIIKGINDLIDKTNSIGTYILNNEDRWSSEGLSEGGDTLEFPLSAINGLQTSSTNKILYYNNDGNWEYKDYKELKFPLSELYDLTSNNLDLDGTKWVLVYDLETLNDRGWKFLPYNTGTGSGLILGKVAYNLNTINNPDTNVKQILVWDNDGNGTWKWLIENYTSTSPTTGLTWTDLTNPGLNKINKSHLPASTWWGRSINDDKVEGNLEGNIQHIRFNYNGNSVYLGLDSDGNLRVSKSENGNDGSNGANFYATGGVSALGNGSSSGGGGGVTPGETSLKSLLNNVNDLGTNYSSPSAGYTIVYDNGSWVDRKLDLSELGDVSINSVSNNDVLTYNGTNWVNSPALSVSSLELLSDVDDTVSDIKALNVIQPSGSSLSYSYPLTLLVGSTSETSSNIYNSEVEWKLYVFLLETDPSAAHLISGGSLTSNMGIVTRLNFGQSGSPMNNYRFPTYITGVRLQSSDMTRYHITGAKHIKGKTINNNNQIWDPDYDETFCSDKVYIINDELYSNANKVLTTDSTLSSSNLNNNSVTVNNTPILLGGSGTITALWTNAKSFTVKNTSGDSISNSPTTNGSSNVDIQLNNNANLGNVSISGNAGSATRLQDNTSHTIWGQTYWSGGQPQNVQGDLIVKPNPSTSTTVNTVSFMLDTRNVAGGNPESNSVLRMLGKNIIDVNTNNSGKKTVDITFGGESTIDKFDQVRIHSKEGIYMPNAISYSSGLVIGGMPNDVRPVLYWDSKNNALALQMSDGSAASFYATGGVSALGIGPNVGSVDTMTFGNLTVNSNLTLGTYATVNKLVMDGNISMHENRLMFETSNETESSITTYYEGGLDGIIINSDHDIVLNASNNYYIMDGSDVYRFNIGAAQTAGILTQM